MSKYYRPLPDCLTIKESEIEGLGLFSTEYIPGGTDLGLTHIYDFSYEDNYIRTPLGGFINYSDTPNCVLIEVDSESNNMNLISLMDLKENEELTIKYNLYNPTI